MVKTASLIVHAADTTAMDVDEDYDPSNDAEEDLPFNPGTREMNNELDAILAEQKEANAILSATLLNQDPTIFKDSSTSMPRSTAKLLQSMRLSGHTPVVESAGKLYKIDPTLKSTRSHPYHLNVDELEKLLSEVIKNFQIKLTLPQMLAILNQFRLTLNKGAGVMHVKVNGNKY